MSKSRNQKLLDVALLIHENCKEHISKNKCHKYIQEESEDTDEEENLD